MFQISNFTNNDDIRVLDSAGPFTVIEYLRDLSVMPNNAAAAYFCNAMNVRKRQVVCDLSKARVTVQSGAMQWMVGNVKAVTGIKGVGDFFGKAVRGKVTGESAIKPEYTGDGVMVLEPTYKHLLLLNLEDWNGSVVLDDGLFLACDSSIRQKAVMRSSFSSAVAGNEGLFNLGLSGNGVVCLESGRCTEGGRQYGHCMEWKSGLYGRTFRKIPYWLCGLRRRTGKCIPGYRKSSACACKRLI